MNASYNALLDSEICNNKNLSTIHRSMKYTVILKKRDTRKGYNRQENKYKRHLIKIRQFYFHIGRETTAYDH